jgi:hypothetical protein
MRRVIGAGVLVGAVFATAACGGDPSSSPSPSPSVSPSPSPSSTAPTPPPLPDAARKDTKAGAVAFVRHYVELLNYAQFTGEVRPLEEVSAKTCETCNSVAQVIDDLYAKGGMVKGGERTLGRHLAQRGAEGGVILFRVRSTPQTIIVPGEQARELPGGDKSEEFHVASSGADWEVTRWSRID